MVEFKPSSAGGLFWLPAIMLSAVLAMVVTWLVVGRYPIPDEDGAALGLVAFLFVVFLDLFLIYGFIGPEFRVGQRSAAIKLAGKFLVWGLLIAAATGLLIWFTTDKPWVLWSVPLLGFVAGRLLRILGTNHNTGGTGAHSSIDSLDLTGQERLLLGSIVLLADQSEPLGEMLKRKGWIGKLFVVAPIVGAIAVILALFFWRQWLFSSTGIMSIVLYFFIAEEIRAFIRFRDERTRDRIIRKLYSALQVKLLDVHS